MTAADPLPDSVDAAFDAAFREMPSKSAQALDCRPEHADDAAFLAALFAACSPLAGLLPEPMMTTQATLKYASHAAAHPHAMRRIATLDGVPIGRLAIDWDGSSTHCIDVAVLPEHRATGAGPRLLRAWLAVADAIPMPATLEVNADNPAARLYRRLGFVATATDDVMIAMTRPVGAATA